MSITTQLMQTSASVGERVQANQIYQMANVL